MKDKKICIFCASSSDINEKYIKTSIELASMLSLEKTELVFGGGTQGIMGEVARVYKKNHASVTSVIPEKLNQKGILFEEYDNLHVTATMNERKKIMSEISDAFIALPGGFGTLEEILEIITLKQLGFLNKPIAVLNAYGFYDFLLKQIDFLYKERFIGKNSLELFFVSKNPSEIYNFLKKSL